MKQIFIEFTRPKAKLFPIYSYLIRLIEKSEYSHVRLRWVTTSGVELIYEASGTQVKLIGSMAIHEHQVEVVESLKFELNDVQYKNLIKLFRFAGVNYSFIQALGILLARILRLNYNPFSKGRNNQVCSELIGVFLIEVLGYKKDLNLDLVGPKDIYKLLASQDNII